MIPVGVNGVYYFATPVNEKSGKKNTRKLNCVKTGKNKKSVANEFRSLIQII
jgi:hypothetical protein